MPKGFAHSPGYNYKIVRRFCVASVLWGLLGSLAGIWLLLLLRWPELAARLGADVAMLGFGRLRPAHGLMLVYGFAVSGLLAIACFVVQRTAQVRMRNDFFAGFSFWGLQAVVVFGVMAVLGGGGQGGGLFDLPWMLDLLLSLVWLSWLWSFFTTLQRRSRAQVYLANWFFGGFATLFGLVHVVTNLALPIAATDSASYPFFAGVADALMRQWQWHVTTTALLIGAFIGALYYLLPRQLNRPLYSFALASANFWLVLVSAAWIGGGYLHWSAAPDWVGSLGSGFAMLFTVAVLAAPLNVMLTLRGHGARLWRDPVLGFLVVATLGLVVLVVAALVLSLRSSSGLVADAGWAGTYVHSLGLGWSAPVLFAGLYFIIPRVWESPLPATAWARAHFLLSVSGALIYSYGQWAGGFAQAQALALRDEYGNLSLGFVETLSVYAWPDLMRLLGGTLFVLGLAVLAVHLWRTDARARRERIEMEALLAQRLGKFSDQHRPAFGQSKQSSQPSGGSR